jgi:hypothetical protein
MGRIAAETIVGVLEVFMKISDSMSKVILPNSALKVVGDISSSILKYIKVEGYENIIQSHDTYINIIQFCEDQWSIHLNGVGKYSVEPFIYKNIMSDRYGHVETLYSRGRKEKSSIHVNIGKAKELTLIEKSVHCQMVHIFLDILSTDFDYSGDEVFNTFIIKKRVDPEDEYWPK